MLSVDGVAEISCALGASLADGNRPVCASSTPSDEDGGVVTDVSGVV